MEQLLIIAILSLVFGSFTSLVTYRLNSKESIVFARSKCPKCQKNLTPLNLIPLFSWLFQRGKCSKCQAKISKRYPLIESAFLIIFTTTFLLLEQKINLSLIIYLAIAAILIFMCIVDLEHYYIPDISQYILAIFVTSLLMAKGFGSDDIFLRFIPAFSYLFFGIALWLFFYFASGLEAIGIDDLKFFFIAGLALGFDNFLFFILLSGIFGAIFGSIWQKIKNDDAFPFGPSICLSFYVCLLIDGQINIVDALGDLIF